MTVAATTRLADLQGLLGEMTRDELTHLRQMVDLALQASAPAPPPVLPHSYIGEVLEDLYQGSQLPWDSRYDQWAKWIVRVDTTKSDGYCFVGEFVPKGTSEVRGGPRLALVMRTAPGTARYHYRAFRVVIWHPDGSVTPTDLQTTAERAGWALRLRDETAALLASLAAGS